MINLISSNYILTVLRLAVIPIVSGLIAYSMVMRSFKLHALSWALIYWISSVATNLVLGYPFLFFINRYQSQDMQFGEFAGVSLALFGLLVLLVILFLSLYEVPFRVLYAVCKDHQQEAKIREGVRYAALLTIILTIVGLIVLYAATHPNPLLKQADAVIDQSEQLQDFINQGI